MSCRVMVDGFSVNSARADFTTEHYTRFRLVCQSRSHDLERHCWWQTLRELKTLQNLGVYIRLETLSLPRLDGRGGSCDQAASLTGQLPG